MQLNAKLNIKIINHLKNLIQFVQIMYSGSVKSGISTFVAIVMTSTKGHIKEAVIVERENLAHCVQNCSLICSFTNHFKENGTREYKSDVS